MPLAAPCKAGDYSGTVAICLRTRPARSVAQRGPQFAGTVPRPRRSAPPRRVVLSADKAGAQRMPLRLRRRAVGPARSDAGEPAAGRIQPGHTRRSRSGPQRRRAGGFPLVIRAAGLALKRTAKKLRRAGGFPLVIRALHCAANPDRDGGKPASQDCCGALRAHRAPVAHRSRETCRPACRSASAPQGAALNGNAGLWPLAADAAAGPDPRSRRRRDTARAQAARRMPVHIQARAGRRSWTADLGADGRREDARTAIALVGASIAGRQTSARTADAPGQTAGPAWARRAPRKFSLS